MYYWPEKDERQLIVCTDTKCDHYEDTEFGHECYNADSSPLYMILGIVGGVVVILVIVVVAVCCYKHGKCSRCKKGYIQIDPEYDTQYIENNDG